MNNIAYMLATSPVIAQIVPENKGYVLDATSSNNDSQIVLIIALSLLIISAGLIVMFVNRSRKRRK